MFCVSVSRIPFTFWILFQFTFSILLVPRFRFRPRSRFLSFPFPDPFSVSGCVSISCVQQEMMKGTIGKNTMEKGNGYLKEDRNKVN